MVAKNKLRVKDLLKEFKNCVIINFDRQEIWLIEENGFNIVQKPEVILKLYEKFREAFK